MVVCVVDRRWKVEAVAERDAVNWSPTSMAASGGV